MFNILISFIFEKLKFFTDKGAVAPTNELFN